MYESPFIFSLVDEVAKEVAEGIDDFVMKATVNAGITVDKDELVKALAYDRGQYGKGYDDGYQDGKRVAARDLVRCKDCENWESDWSSCADENKHYCVMIDGFTFADFYCGYGEQKDGADECIEKIGEGVKNGN